jgi:hypothetical protein
MALPLFDNSTTLEPLQPREVTAAIRVALAGQSSTADAALLR